MRRRRVAQRRSKLPSVYRLKCVGQEFWNRGENILTISSKRVPPVPPLRLSTFDPFGGGSSTLSTPIQQQQPQPQPQETAVEETERKSPRLEAKGTEPVPPPPPPRWCKPQLIVPPGSLEEPTSRSSPTEEKPSVAVVVRQPKVDERRPVLRRKRRRQRRKRSSSSTSSAVPPSPHCHHSSLADKASDYEDIWGTSPGDSQDEEVEEAEGDDDATGSPVARPAQLAHEEDTALSERCCSMSSNRSSNSTLEKATSASSDHRADDDNGLPASRSLTSSPELMSSLPVERIEPPELFQEERRSITIIEIRHSPVRLEKAEKEEGDEEEVEQVVIVRPETEDKENDIPEPPLVNLNEEPSTVSLRRRTASCSSSTESGSRDNSRRTSPLYSEPADAIPPQLQPPPAWLKKQQQKRPLPQPPFSTSNTSTTATTMDFQTFTKDGYVRCTLPALTQSSFSSTNPRVTVLPPLAGGLNNKSKQVVMPKPPRQLPTSSFSRDQHDQPRAHALPSSVVYLPTATEDDSLTIQVYPLTAQQRRRIAPDVKR